MEKVIRNSQVLKVDEIQSGDIVIESLEELHPEVKKYMMEYTSMIKDDDTGQKFTFSPLWYRIDEDGNFWRINTTYLPENIREAIKPDLQYLVDRF